MGVADAKSSKTVKLYLRLPVKIIDEQHIKDLHPGILKVSLPRQKSRRWCIVEFDSATTKSALGALRSLKIEGKKVLVKSHHSNKKGASA